MQNGPPLSGPFYLRNRITDRTRVRRNESLIVAMQTGT